jgi:AraC family transcriptional regulator of adaptative response/methylated-DNA-[protein]-cysteine methyltransferase
MLGGMDEPTTQTAALETSQDFLRIARAIGYVAGHVQDQPALADIAAAAGWSEFHFARVFRRWAGISPKQLLQHLSLVAAKQTLDDGRSVLQAALDAGLSGPGRLHDLFVTLEAVTPGEYKSHGRGITMRHGTAATPFGLARIAFTDRGVAFLAFLGDAADAGEGWNAFRHDWRDADWREDPAGTRDIAATIWSLAPGGKRELTLWLHGSNFQLQVWRALLAAGVHGTVSYMTLARQVGRDSASRAVGGAVGANPIAWLIPCHRVLRANGALGGYRWGVERKLAMLTWEVARSLAVEDLEDPLIDPRMRRVTRAATHDKARAAAP